MGGGGGGVERLARIPKRLSKRQRGYYYSLSREIQNNVQRTKQVVVGRGEGGG